MPVAFFISSDVSTKKCEIGPEGNLIEVDVNNIMTVFSIFYPRILWLEA